MVQRTKTQRVKLSVVEQKPGMWVMQKTTDSTTTLPFTWPTRESAIHDMDIVVQSLVVRGYTVVNDDGKEVNA